MSVTVEVLAAADYTPQPTDAIVVPRFSDVDLGWSAALDDHERTALAAMSARESSPAKTTEHYWLPTPTGRVSGIAVATLGRFDEFNAETFRRTGGSLVETLRRNGIRRIVVDATQGEALPVEALIEGVLLGGYAFSSFKSDTEKAKKAFTPNFVVLTDDASARQPIAEGCRRVVDICDSVNWARNLANRPPNSLPPRALASEAQRLAKQLGFKADVLDVDRMAELGMNGILAVGQGSSEPPKLIVLEYSHPDADRKLALVGKGITFDTGGISLKPSPDMHEMKYDMGGAAAVLGAMRALTAMKPKINLVAVIPTAENKTGADAYLPGDILQMYDGQSVEVLNTDAEGRLILADALAYTEEIYAPDAIVEASTLTGAIVAALGHYAAGLFTKNPDLAAQLQLAAEASGDRLWPMPMWSDYDRLLDDSPADMSNIGPRGQAGSIVAACFLQRFVKKTPFAHVDIAGAAWDAKNISYLDPKVAAGFGVRLFVQWVLDELEQGEEA